MQHCLIDCVPQALFWQQHNFFGVDLTPLHGSAFQGYFSQVTFHGPHFIVCEERYLLPIQLVLKF
jgi:hypothetical protein